MTTVAEDNFASVLPAVGKTPTTLESLASQLSPRIHHPLVYVTRRIPQKGMEILLRDCDVKQWDSEQAVPLGELLHTVNGAEAILCMPCDTIDACVLDAAGPQLRLIATMSVSRDHIDMEACTKRNIRVITCPSQPAQNLAELTVALVLLTIKDSLSDAERLLIEPQPPDLIGDDGDGFIKKLGNSRPQFIRQHSEEQLAYQLNNGKPCNTNCLAWKNITQKTFGIYGLTQTGISVSKLLKELNVHHVLVADEDYAITCTAQDQTNPPQGNEDYNIVSLDTLLQESDVICVCGSDGVKSQQVFNKKSFRLMKSSAILVTSQSEEKAVDYIHLYEALRDGQIKAAGLNDCNQVPVPFKTPLLGLKNCIFLPQSQESVYDLRHKISVLIAKNLTDALKSSSK